MVAPKSKSKMKKGPWTKDEDGKLLDFIQQHDRQGFSWCTIPEKTGLERCGRSCRMRWTNYLRPDIKKGNFTIDEENTIIRLHAFIGNKWSVIASHLPNRTDNEIKNYWRSSLKKRLIRMGIDPITHMPKKGSQSHMAQWETTRVEAEARLARDSKLVQPRAPCLDVLNVWQSSTLPSSFFSPPTSNRKQNNMAMNNYSDQVIRGETENSHAEMTMMGSMDLTTFNQDSDMINGPVLGEYYDDDDEATNYWKYLLHLVSSTMDSPATL